MTPIIYNCGGERQDCQQCCYRKEVRVERNICNKIGQRRGPPETTVIDLRCTVDSKKVVQVVGDTLVEDQDLWVGVH